MFIPIVYSTSLLHLNVLSMKGIFTERKRSLGQGNIFGIFSGGVVSQHALHVVSQHALQVVSQHALHEGSPGPHPGGGEVVYPSMH